MTHAPLDVFIVAGEESGDQLGARLMRSLKRLAPGATFRGVGGRAMAEQGLDSLFPISDIAVMGFAPVIKRLPLLLRRIRETAEAAIAKRPDVLVIVDSPDFTHRVARKVRARHPDLPVVDYVCPSVWAWRPKRAQRMAAYIDHVLALLPFEPDALTRLHGPAATYVGHPLIERLDELQPSPDEARARDGERPTLLILPGSRRSELERLMPVFAQVLQRIAARSDVAAVLPAVARHEAAIRAMIADWPVKPEIVTGEAAKYAAFRRARAALAASGTVTLELALAGVPTVVAYKVSKAEEMIARRLVTVPSIVLPNLILRENVYPEFIQDDCNPATLDAALAPLLDGGAARDRQLEGLGRLDMAMRLPDGDAPGDKAARVVLHVATPDRRAR